MGRSYDTASGRVVTMTTSDEGSDVTVMMGNIEMDREVRVIPLPTTDDIISGGPLNTIREVKTPTSPLEPTPGVCDIHSDVISGAETGSGVRILDLHGGRETVISPLTTLLPTKCPLTEQNLSPAPSPGHLTGMMSPSVARVVC